MKDTVSDCTSKEDEKSVEEPTTIRQGEEEAWSWTSAYAKWDAWDDNDEDELKSLKNDSARAKRGAVPGFPACSHDHKAEQAVANLSETEKEAACLTFRNKGNGLFAEGQFKRAALQYQRAIVYGDYAFPPDEESQARMDRIHHICLLNSAACFLKVGELSEALKFCNQVLDADPFCVKALYRRAAVHTQMDNFTSARADLHRGLEIVKGCDGSTPQTSAQYALLKEMRLLRGREASYRDAQIDISKRMIGESNSSRKDNALQASTLKLTTQSTMTAATIPWRKELYNPTVCIEALERLDDKSSRITTNVD